MSGVVTGNALGWPTYGAIAASAFALAAEVSAEAALPLPLPLGLSLSLSPPPQPPIAIAATSSPTTATNLRVGLVMGSSEVVRRGSPVTVMRDGDVRYVRP